MLEKPSNGRSEIFNNGQRLEIVIPSKKNWFLVIFLSAWLCGWLMGESFAITQLFDSETPLFANAFLIVWLTLWTIGGAFAITILFWMVIGKEKLLVDSNVLEIGKHIFSFKISKKYDINEVKHLATNPAHENDFWGMNYQRSLLGVKSGALKFDYGLKTIKFASAIEEAEGRLILDLFKKNSNFRESNFN
jgi:hypothetical protein